jgi:hypothetical protein
MRRRQSRGRATQNRGGLGNPDKDTKWGCSFLGATSLDTETDCSHGRPDVGVRPNVQALVVSIAYWAPSLRRARTQGSRCTRPDGRPNHSITTNQIKSREENGCPEDQIKSTEENICLFFPLLLILLLPNIIP